MGRYTLNCIRLFDNVMRLAPIKLLYFFDRWYKVIDMRRSFAIFLTFLVLLPSLACAMPVCSMSQPVDAQNPCHDQMDNDQTNPDKLMILQDCMGIDFQVAEKVSDFGMKDKGKDTFDQVPVIVATNNWSILASKSPPRAPPLSRISLQFEPSIVLTTQRFRI